MDFDLTSHGYSLCIVSTGGNHADLNEDYASVPAEMKAAASHFGKPVLREVGLEQLIAEIPALREKYGDRAILRAFHFINENKRVKAQTEALRDGDLDAFFDGVLASGNSSFEYLQNVYTTKNVSEQGLSLALALAQYYLADKGGAWRVHGGGFAGTTQAYVRNEDVEGYRALMDGAFGEGACIVLRVRAIGAGKVI
jgi:galactokinase